jgi:Ca2+-binding EF-hand superfamily protein
LCSPLTAAELPRLPDDVFASTAGAVIKLPDDVFAPIPGDDVTDVIIFGPSRAAVIRLHVTVNGKGFRSAWAAFLLRLHAYLDTNGDGLLTESEANRAPWTQIFDNPFNGRVALQVGKRPVAIDATPKDGIVTIEELANYLRGTRGTDAVGMQAGPPPDARLEAVFGQLDRDGDKVLSSIELAETDLLLARLDTDEDELVELNELTPDRSPLADRFGRRNQTGGAISAESSQVVALDSSEVRSQVAARLLKAFGKQVKSRNDLRVGPGPLGADAAAFRAADADGDGTLVQSELVRYLAGPTVHLEASVALSKDARGNGQIQTKPGKSAHDLTTRQGNGGIVVPFDGSEIALRAFDNPQQQAGVQFFQNQFKAADADKNGVVDAKEARGNFFLNRIFPVADHNADGKMTEPEMNLYIDHSRDAAECRTMLTIADLGMALHEQLDADHDTRLSLRELRNAAERLKNLDRDGDGRISQAELPRRAQLNVGRGDPQNGPRAVVFASGPEAARAGARPDRPAWFVGMDRNGDGDVSLREFLGSPAQFRAFDSDGDGLIDAQEAARTP